MSDNAWSQNSDALAAFGASAQPRRPPQQQQQQQQQHRSGARSRARAAPDAFSTLVADAFAEARPASTTAPAAGADPNPYRAGSSARTADPFASNNGAARPADPFASNNGAARPVDPFASNNGAVRPADPFADADSLYEALPAPPARPAAHAPLPANPFAPPMRTAAPMRARAPAPAPVYASSTGYPPPLRAPPPAMLAPTPILASPIVAPPSIVAPPTLATLAPPSPIARRRPGNPFPGPGADADPRLGAPTPRRPGNPFAPGADPRLGAPPRPGNPFAPGGLADAWTAADADLNFGLLLGAGAPDDASSASDGGGTAKRRRERTHSLKELLATERIYRNQLACVVERLQGPLAWACAGGPAPPDAADARALPGAEDARALHAALDPLPAATLLAISDALIAQLAARTADGGTERVGEVFEAAAPKVLEAMCSWYDWHERAASELRRLTEASAGARAFVRRAEADARCGDGRAAPCGTQPVVRAGMSRRRCGGRSLELKFAAQVRRRCSSRRRSGSRGSSSF